MLPPSTSTNGTKSTSPFSVTPRSSKLARLHIGTPWARMPPLNPARRPPSGRSSARAMPGTNMPAAPASRAAVEINLLVAFIIQLLHSFGVTATVALQAANSSLIGKSPFARRFRRSGRPALLGGHRSLANEIDETGQRVFAIALLAAEALRRDHDNTVLRHPPPSPGFEAAPHALVQVWRCIDREAQLNRARHLVDVLAARAARPDELLLDLALVQGDGVGDSDHGA